MSRRHQLDINRLGKPQYHQVYLLSKSEQERFRLVRIKTQGKNKISLEVIQVKNMIH